VFGRLSKLRNAAGKAPPTPADGDPRPSAPQRLGPLQLQQLRPAAQARITLSIDIGRFVTYAAAISTGERDANGQ